MALICYTSERNGRRRNRQVFPRSEFVHRCLAELRQIGVPVFDVMLVRDSLVWSYLQHDPGSEGYPIPGESDPDIRHLHSAHVGAGRAVMSDRGALAASVVGPAGPAHLTNTDEVMAAATRFTAAISERDYRGTVEVGWAIAERALAEGMAAQVAGRPAPLSNRADLIAVMTDANVRDSVISWAIQHAAEEPLPMFIELARTAPDDWCAPVCCALAVVAYRAGDGALAQVAVDRALTAEPKSRLAVLLAAFFSSGSLPEELDVLAIPWTGHPANPEAPMWQHGAGFDHDVLDEAERTVDSADRTGDSANGALDPTDDRKGGDDQAGGSGR